jgi:type IV pilus assembly protein PilA
MLKKLRKMLKKQEGFTLVELMIVVVILGIISGIGIQQYGRVQENARKAADVANRRVLLSAVQMYLMLEPDAGSGEITPEALVDAGYLQEPAPVSPWDGETEYEITVEWSEDNTIPTITVSLPNRPD